MGVLHSGRGPRRREAWQPGSLGNLQAATARGAKEAATSRPSSPPRPPRIVVVLPRGRWTWQRSLCRVAALPGAARCRCAVRQAVSRPASRVPALRTPCAELPLQLAPEARPSRRGRGPRFRARSRRPAPTLGAADPRMRQFCGLAVLGRDHCCNRVMVQIRLFPPASLKTDLWLLHVSGVA